MTLASGAPLARKTRVKQERLSLQTIPFTDAARLIGLLNSGYCSGDAPSLSEPDFHLNME